MKIAIITLLVSFLFFTISCKSKQNKIKKTEEVVETTTKKESTHFVVTELNDVKNLLKNPTLIFNFEEGTVSGNTGCNQYGGKVSFDDYRIRFSPQRITKIYCEKTAHIEKAFTTAIANADSFMIEGRQFSLFNGKGIRLLLAIDKDQESSLEKKNIGISVSPK